MTSSIKEEPESKRETSRSRAEVERREKGENGRLAARDAKGLKAISVT